MKKIILVAGVFLLSWGSVQGQGSGNVFQDSEQQSTASSSDTNTYDKGPGNPGPVPIDHYLPLLLIVGSSIIFWQRRKLLKVRH